jgi:hypothetical protein|nr:MAG TPA: hypothetical protein [Caudoviricetes sp.]
MFSIFKPKPKRERHPITGQLLYPVSRTYKIKIVDPANHEEVADVIAKYLHDQFSSEDWYHQVTIKLYNEDDRFTTVEYRIVFIPTTKSDIQYVSMIGLDRPENERNFPTEPCWKVIKTISKIERLNYANDMHLIRKYGVEYQDKVNVLRMSFFANAVFELNSDVKVYLEDKNLTEMRDSIADAISKQLDKNSKLFEYFKLLVSPAIRINLYDSKFQVDITYPVDNPIYPYSEDMQVLLYHAIQSLKDSGLFIFDKSGVEYPINSKIISFRDSNS